MEIFFDALPVVSFRLSAAGGFGITIRDLMVKLTHQINRPLTVEDWNAKMSVDQRYQVLVGYGRRTGSIIDMAAMEDIQGHAFSHARSYVISDALADNHMFLGLALGDGDPIMMGSIYTCKREQCRQ
jgi:hypothetical protein